MSTGLNGVNPSMMKLEVRYVDPNRPPVRKVSGGAKFASALGSFLGPVASVAGFFFPPMFAVGAAAYGMKNVASQSIARQQAFINAEQSAHQSKGPQMISYMGYESDSVHMRPVSTSHPGVAPGQDPVMNILFQRQKASQQMIQTNYQGE
jgi:hypothetical protein